MAGFGGPWRQVIAALQMGAGLALTSTAGAWVMTEPGTQAFQCVTMNGLLTGIAGLTVPGIVLPWRGRILEGD